MCGHHGHGHHQHGRGRRGFPSREQWVERLESLRERLDQDLQNVDDLLKRLREERPETTSV